MSRMPPVEHTNQPTTSRRRPAPEPTPAGTDLTATSEKPNWLGGDHRTGDWLGDDQSDSTTGSGGVIGAMLANRSKVDPMLDLVSVNSKLPRHLNVALDMLAFARNTTKRALIEQAVADLVGPELAADALKASPR
nr:hypothetical protein [Micromonospora sp. DSM 115978]